MSDDGSSSSRSRGRILSWSSLLLQEYLSKNDRKLHPREGDCLLFGVAVIRPNDRPTDRPSSESNERPAGWPTGPVLELQDFKYIRRAFLKYFSSIVPNLALLA